MKSKSFSFKVILATGLLFSACMGNDGFRVQERFTEKSGAIFYSQVVDCDAGSKWNGHGWPRPQDCQRKITEGSFSGSCEQNPATGCYGIPGGQSSTPTPIPPQNPTPLPPGTTPTTGEKCDAGGSWNGRGWRVQNDCLRKIREGSFAGSCEFNTTTNCFGVPGGSAPVPQNPAPETPPTPSQPSTGICNAGGSWNGQGWRVQNDCNRKLSEGSFCGVCDFNNSTGCFGVPMEDLPIPVPPMPPGPYPTNGDGIANFVKHHYPEYLVPTANVCGRKMNMAFLRNRMIEVGICAGFDTGLNLKRGGPDLSIDFLAYRVDGVTIGVDIGVGYDDETRPLRVDWNVSGGGTYLRYEPRPSCH